MRILFLSAFFPSPKADSAGVLDVYHMMRELSQRHEVYLISLATKAEIKDKHLLDDVCKEVLLVRAPTEMTGLSYKVYTLLSIFSSLPAISFTSKTRRLDKELDHFLRNHVVDVVQVEFTQFAHYVKKVMGLPVVLDESDIAYVRRTRFTKSLRWGLSKLFLLHDCRKLKQYETRHLKEFDTVLVRTEADKSTLGKLIPNQLFEVIPPWIELAPNQEVVASKQDALMFYGAMWRNVNSQAAEFFIKSVFPIISDSAPDVRLFIVGSNPPASLLDLASDRIVITGFVDSIVPYYQRCAIAVVPLLAGSGIKGKVVQALSFGLPVVTTPIGAEGIPASENDGVFVSEKPEDMARAVLLLLKDQKYREYSTSARKFVRQFYDWANGIQRLEGIYESVMERAVGSHHPISSVQNNK